MAESNGQMLGKYFSLAEMIASDTATRLAIHDQQFPSAIVIDNLKLLCQKILDPLREAAGPLKISSGFRCEKLNKAVGGQPGSQHKIGEAADIKGIDFTNAEIFYLIQKLNLPYDQLIWEYGTKKNPAWVHVSYSKVRTRKQILYIGV